MTERYHVDTTQGEWKPYKPGIDMITLRLEPGQRRFLVRFQPGAEYPEHRHPECEELFILQGSLVDSGHTYSAGSYVYLGPGSAHKPSAPEGCLMLVLAPVPADML